jgi:hypothetical protein
MTYRLSEKYSEPELEAWVERQRVSSQWVPMWFGGIAVGVILGYALAVIL